MTVRRYIAFHVAAVWDGRDTDEIEGAIQTALGCTGVEPDCPMITLSSCAGTKEQIMEFLGLSGVTDDSTEETE